MLNRVSEREGRVLWVRVATGVVIVVVLAMAGTTLRYALRAGLDLAALGILAVFGWLAFHSLPLFGRYVEKRVLRARLHEARNNPVEQLMQKHLQRRDQLRRDKEALAMVGCQLIGMQELMERQRASAPNRDWSKQTAMVDLMTSCHARLASRMKETELVLARERELLDEKRFKWEFSQAGKRVAQGLWDRDRDSIVATLEEDEALRAVESNFAQVMASIELETLPPEPPGPSTRTLKA